MIAEEFHLPEDVVSARLGVDRNLLRKARGPENGRWAFGANRRVLWSEKGVAEFQAGLDAPAGPSEPAPESDLQILEVWNSKVPNRRSLLAYPQGSNPENAAAEERCVVYLGANGDNRRFIPGMKILARHHRGATWWFEGNPDDPKSGRRMPRGIGRW